MSRDFSKTAGVVRTIFKARDRFNERVQALDSESEGDATGTRGGHFREKGGPPVPQEPRPGQPGYSPPANNQPPIYGSQPYHQASNQYNTPPQSGSPPQSQLYHHQHQPPYQYPQNQYGRGYHGGQPYTPTPQSHQGYPPSYSSQDTSSNSLSSHSHQSQMQGSPPLGQLSRTQSDFYPQRSPQSQFMPNPPPEPLRTYTDPSGSPNYGGSGYPSSGYGPSSYGTPPFPGSNYGGPGHGRPPY